MILIIDNYDSFTYNVVQTLADYLQEQGSSETIEVYRNDRISLDEIASLQPRRLIVSPGPCTPAEAGISVAAIQRFAGELPVLGICLGHQAIGAAFGGTVIRAGRIMHGKTSTIRHDRLGVYRGLPESFEGMRYHSLVVEEVSLPSCLKVTARSEYGELMGLRHRSLAVEGVQFHPESIMTTVGKQLLANFLDEDFTAAFPDISESIPQSI